MASNAIRIIELTQRLAKASNEADELYIAWLSKLTQVKEHAEELKSLIDKQLRLPNITLEGLEIDG